MSVGSHRGEPGSLEVSEIRLRLRDEEQGGLLGFASCVLGGSYFLNNIAIRRGADGQLYLSYPATRSNQDVEHFHWNPITRDASRVLEQAILGRLQAMGR